MAIGIPITIIASGQELRAAEEPIDKNARAEICVFEDWHFTVYKPTDLGNGLVGGLTTGASGIGMFSVWNASDCETGQNLDVTFNKVFWGGHPEVLAIPDQDKMQVVPDRTSAQEEFLSRAVSMEEATIQKLHDLARESEIFAEFERSNEEACGCAAFYPEMVGDKEPSRMRDEMPTWGKQK